MKFDMVFLVGFYGRALCAAAQSWRAAVSIAFVTAIVAGAVVDF
jgi:hypothetical protein